MLTVDKAMQLNLNISIAGALPLTCVGGGWLGSDDNFQDFAACLKPQRIAYQLRVGSLDETAISVEQLADIYLVQLRKNQPRGPYQLLGYSFGGLIAHAMAVALLEKGEEVSLLALIDTPNPQFVPSDGFGRSRKTYLIKRLQKYARNLMRGRIDYIAIDIGNFVMGRLKPVNWKINEMWNSYRPRHFNGLLVLVRAENRNELDSDWSWGWRKSADKVDVHFVRGDHVEILRAPTVSAVIEKLTPYLTTSVHRVS